MLATHSITSHRRTWLFDLVGLALLFVGFYTLWLGHYPLFIPDEGRYAEAAREMLTTGDFVTPRVNGVAFLDKPILYYWLEAVAMRWFGINEWAIRFFPALLSVFGCLYTYVCGRQLFNRRTGFLSSMILALTPLYFGGAHYADLNMEVAVFISCTLQSFITGVQSIGWKRPLFLFSAYIFAALAFLTKGMIGIAFPGMICGLWIMLLWRWATLKNIYLVTGLVLFIFIALPWYLIVQRENPAFLHYFFVTQQVSRFLSAGSFNNPTPVWFYLPVILIGFLPWSLFVIQAIQQACRHVWQERHAHQTMLFLLLWISVIFLFFSIPKTKTIGYIFPIFPALALITGHYLAATWSKTKKITIILFAIISTLFLSILLLMSPQLNKKSSKSFAKELITILQPNDEVVNYYQFYQDLPIYLQRRITLVADWQSPDIATNDNWVRELWYGKEFQDTNTWLINEPAFWEKWYSKKRVFVFLNENQFKRFKSHARYYFYLDSDHHVILLSNEPTLYKARWIRN